MADRSHKRQKPTDINQLAKAIVDLATGNPIHEDPPVELKKRPLAIKRRVGLDGNKTYVEKTSAKKQPGISKKAT